MASEGTACTQPQQAPEGTAIQARPHLMLARVAPAYNTTTQATEAGRCQMQSQLRLEGDCSKLKDKKAATLCSHSPHPVRRRAKHPGPSCTLPWISPHHQKRGFWAEAGERGSAFCPWGWGGPSALCLRGDTKDRACAQAMVSLSFTQGPNPCDEQEKAGYSPLNPLEAQLSPQDNFTLQERASAVPCRLPRFPSLP